MLSIIIVDNPKNWNFDLPDVEIVSAKSYLTDSKYSEIKNVRIYNLCKNYSYQSIGYYVSLLAEARGHRAIPSVTTIQDLKSQSIFRGMSDEIDELIQSSFSKLKPKSFKLNIYFGKTINKRYEKLASQLYNLFQTPLLESIFVYNKKWILQNVNPLPINEISEDHLSYFIDFAKNYFGKKRIRLLKKNTPIYDLAILIDPTAKLPPSNKRAINNFIKAAESIGFRVKLITKDDYSRIPEFDALFIRENTEVNHYTYRFARKADTENLVVIDDPTSIVKCTNKVYLTELLTKAKIPIPLTMIVSKDNKDEVVNKIGFPCVLKKPDGSFSTGVIKVSNAESFKIEVDKFLNKSDLIIAQEFIPTEFDWRVCFLDRKPLFACKYFMAKNHWQVVLNAKTSISGSVEAVAIDDVPKNIMQVADKSASLIGDGFYGVDLKVIDDKVVVIEINDNPDVDAGRDDCLLKEELYLTIMRSFLNRIEAKKTKQIAKNNGR